MGGRLEDRHPPTNQESGFEVEITSAQKSENADMGGKTSEIAYAHKSRNANMGGRARGELPPKSQENADMGGRGVQLHRRR